MAGDLDWVRGKLSTGGLGDVAESILRHHKENLEQFEAFEAFRARIRSCELGDRAALDQNFRELLFKWFEKKLVVVHDYYIGGDGGHDWGTWRAHLVYMLPKLWRAKSLQSTSASRR